MPDEPDLGTRGRLIRSLGTLRDMLPGSFVERKRTCGRPNCHCADGKNLHSQFQVSVLVEGKPRPLTSPPSWSQRCASKLKCAIALMPPLPPSVASI